MEILAQFIFRTPIWAWALLAWLVFRGIKARRPGDTTLSKLAMIPAIFTAWGLYDLMTLYGVTGETTGLWLVGIALGAALGWFIAARFDIVADRAAGVIHRPADFSLLPLLLLTFGVKYSFGVIGSVAPDLLAEPAFKSADLILSGVFTGVFVGKYLRYVWIWRTVSLTVPALTDQPTDVDRAAITPNLRSS